MKPNERIALNDFYQLYGRHLYAEEWNNNAIYFLNSKSPTLVGFDLSSDELDALIKQGQHLNKMAVQNAKEITKHLIKHLNRVFFIDNQRTSYEYHGEVIEYDFINSKCIDNEGKSHLCEITLKPSSDLIDRSDIDLFDPDVSDNALSKYKQILVSEAILKHLIYYGMPANNEELLQILKQDFQSKYSKKEKFSDNVVRENIKRMLSIWQEIKK
jgi:hypothetical protein